MFKLKIDNKYGGIRKRRKRRRYKSRMNLVELEEDLKERDIFPIISGFWRFYNLHLQRLK